MVKIRRAYEGLFLGLFLFFLLITDLRYLKGWPVSLFLEATPLVAVATALTTHTIYRNLVWGLVIIAVTMMLGRVWCNWMCPFGILHHIFGIIGNRRNTKQMIEVNRYRKIYAVKYYILAAMIAMAGLWIIPTTIDAPGKIRQVYHGAELKQSGLSRVFAAVGSGMAQSADEHKLGNSSLQIGLLDPIALTVRSMTTSVLPTVDKATEGQQLADQPPAVCSQRGAQGHLVAARGSAHQQQIGHVGARDQQYEAHCAHENQQRFPDRLHQQVFQRENLRNQRISVLAGAQRQMLDEGLEFRLGLLPGKGRPQPAESRA